MPDAGRGRRVDRRSAAGQGGVVARGDGGRHAVPVVVPARLRGAEGAADVGGAVAERAAGADPRAGDEERHGRRGAEQWPRVRLRLSAGCVGPSGRQQLPRVGFPLGSSASGAGFVRGEAADGYGACARGSVDGGQGGCRRPRAGESGRRADASGQRRPAEAVDLAPRSAAGLGGAAGPRQAGLTADGGRAEGVPHVALGLRAAPGGRRCR